MPSLVSKLRSVLLRAWFTATFVAGVSFSSVAARIIHLMFFYSLQKRCALSAQAAGLGFRFVMLCNPQVSAAYAHAEDEPHWEELFSGDAKPLVLINHTSQFDSVFYSAVVPLAQIGRLKTLAKASLFKTPIFGKIMEACGHFPVHFKEEKSLENFSVDKTAQDEVMKQLDAHVAAGGGISMFPEGIINRSDCSELQSFRRGSFAVARKHNMKLWAFLHTGVDVLWPISHTVGGFDSHIRFRLFRVPDPPQGCELSEYVDHVQRVMQKELDLLYMLDRGASAADVKAKRAELAGLIHETARGDEAVEAGLTRGVEFAQAAST
jgi:1-acyl-sn-glycerol-3-phosphate acyltransferase